MDKLRQAALTEQQAEPVADTLGHVGFQEWWDTVADDYDVGHFKIMRRAWNAAVKYEAPPKRLPLTDEEIWEALSGIDCTRPLLISRAIEAAHGIG